MRIAEIPERLLLQRLSSEGVGVDFGAARSRIRTKLPACARLIQAVYGGYMAEDSSGMFDVTVDLRRVRGIRGHVRPQCELVCDGIVEQEPFPLDTSLPLLEWGTNFALATRLFCYLLLHAGVVERGGRAIVMPAMPGSGKSTLTAALTLRGFRLLSDEFGVVRLQDARLLRMLRPLALKNESIDVADPALVVFPRFEPGAGVVLEPVRKTRAFARLAVNSFNYQALGPEAFEALAQLVDESSCWQLRYSDLGGAVKALGELLDETRPTEEGMRAVPRSLRVASRPPE
jgi:hypothetical protein